MDTEETPLLPQPEPSPTLYYSKKAYLIAKHPFSVFLAAGSILVLICWMLDGMGYPAPQNLDSSLVLDGEAASGLYAWDIVKNITTEPHSWNTDTNLAVKAFLSHEIYRLEQEYMSWNCPFANPFKVI